MIVTSGQYSFNPSGGDIITYAYSLCGIRRSELLIEHMTDARLALNMILGAWGNSTPNLWKVDLVSVGLVTGTATYDVDPNTIMILDAYIHTEPGGVANDRIIWPISRTEYAAMPNKTLEAPPTVYWFDRTLSPQITLWQTPDADGGPYTLRYYRVISIQDANLGGGETVDIPPLWLNALALSTAAQLALSYAPDRADRLDARARTWLMEARAQNVENVPIYIMPTISSYWPR